MTQPVASIDLGTNSARLLIASTNPYRQIFLKRMITRLGGGFTRERGLSPEAQQRSLAALREFARELGRHEVQNLRAVATSAVRDAVNGREFCRLVQSETGISLEVIDGHEEAELTLQGVYATLDRVPGELSIFDIGGGSTEFTLATEGELVFSRSLPLGVVRLTEGKASVAEMEEKIGRELSLLKKEMERKGVAHRFSRGTLVGTAGTATTLAAMQLKLVDYDYSRVNNFVISLEEVETIFQKMLPLTPAQRLELPGLEPGREDLIISGTLLVIWTMRLFGFSSMKVSDAGLLEGLIVARD